MEVVSDDESRGPRTQGECAGLTRNTGCQEENMIQTDMPSSLIDKLDHHSREFLQRVYSGDMKRYEDRIKALGFVDKERVLDAGCGFGQWSIALSRFNKQVCAIELSLERLKVSKAIARNLSIDNIFLTGCSIDTLPFRSGSFDAVFCYSVIYNTDYEVTLREFSRILKSNGALYLCTNGLGWYIYNIIRRHNPAENFNPRIYALRSILKTIGYYIAKQHKPGASLVMSPGRTAKYLEKLGFNSILSGGDGTISLDPTCKAAPFYPERYLNLSNVFEVLAIK